MSEEQAPGEPWHYVIRVSLEGRADPERGPEGPYTLSEARARETGTDPVSGWRSVAVAPVAAETAGTGNQALSWPGIRVTLACGHLDLRQPQDDEQRERWVTGGITACWVCPSRERRAAVRQIVNVEAVTAPRPPEHLGSEHWYWDESR